ncbi:MAG: DNA polymerase III subunit gamma/tau [Nodosilinea sp.]
MAYEPLHHKYRPQTFGALVGQDAIATTLSNALRQQRIAPAYLFCGPRGTGKTSSARILAKSLNCIAQDHPTPEPCGTCETCRSITNGSALDFIEIDAASNTGVDNIRELIERAQFAPVQCRYKVYVIDECLTGDTLVLTQDGLVRVDDPTLVGKRALSYNEQSGTWEFKEILRWFDQGTRDILEIRTAHRRIRCTGNHLIRTNQGWVAAREITAGTQILSPAPAAVAPSLAHLAQMGDLGDLSGGISTWMMAPLASVLRAVPKFSFILRAIPPQKITSLLNGLPTWATPLKSDPIQGAVAGSSITTLPWEPTQHENGWLNSSPSLLPPWTTNLEMVVSVRPAGSEPVYDIEVEDNHNFVANGLLVHNCHMLSTAAFNALLKTLEEPPSNVVFILATTDPQRVLPTIISRCQKFDYRRIPLEPMIGHLRNIASLEGIDIDDDALRLVAQVSQGGLRDAQSLLDQLSLLEPPVGADAVWDLVGAVPERDLLALVQAILSDDGTAVLDRARKLMDRGREPLIVLQNLAGFYRDLLIAKTAGDRQDLVAITPPTWADMQTLVQTLDPTLFLLGQQHLRAAEGQVKNTTQPRLWLEVTLLGLLPSTLAGQAAATTAIASPPATGAIARPTLPVSPPPPTASPAPAARTLSDAADSVNGTAPGAPSAETARGVTPNEQPPEPVAASSAPPPPNGQEPPPDSGTTSAPDLNQLWLQVIAVLEPLGTRALMQQQGSLLFFDGVVARVGISSRPLFKMAQGRVDNVEAAFQAVLGQRVQVSLEVLPDPKPEAPAPAVAVAPSPVDYRPMPPERSPTPPTVAEPLAAVTQPNSNQPDNNQVEVKEPEAPSLPAIASDFDRAVKTFANFFNGQVVDLDDGPGFEPAPLKPSEAAAKQPSHPDKDVPF